jgi:hypothetical protein
LRLSAPASRDLRLLLALAAAAWGGGAARAQAADNASSGAATPGTISIEGGCPDGGAIERAITALIPRGTAALPESARVIVADAGESYRVEVRSDAVTRARLFRDAARDCEQRARFAAVFIVLTLLPPDLAAAPPPKAPAPPPAPPPPPVVVAAAPPPAPRRWRLELAALAEAAPAAFQSTSMLALGGQLQAARRLGRIEAALSVGVEPRIDFTIGGLQVRELRVPIGAGVRVRRATHGVELAGELAIVAAPFHAEGRSSAMPSSGTRLDLGGRAGAQLRLGGPDRRWAPFLGLQLSVFPWPYEIASMPAGALGTTPPLWLGATAGVAAAL